METQTQTYELAVIDTPAVTPSVLRQQVNAIQAAMKEVMEVNVHYGKIPGCGDKPTLLKPGAEKIGLMFRLVPKFDVKMTDLANGHREYQIICTLVSPSGMLIGQGVGLCSTMETKYRYRGVTSESTGKEVPKAYWDNDRDVEIIGGKQFIAVKEDNGKWYIHKKGEKKENQDIADTYNTVLKIGKKRAHVDAILTCTAASDIFTQDIEDLPADIIGQGKGTTPKTTIIPADDLPKSEKKKYLYDIGYNEGKELKDKIKASGGGWDKELKKWVSYVIIPELEAPNFEEINSQAFDDDEIPGFD